MVLNPGQGAFVDNASTAFTVTFVGEVQLTSSLTIRPGLDTYSSVIPQSGPLPSLGFPTPTAALTVNRFNGTGFDSFAYDLDLADWSPSVPTVDVAESVFIDNTGPAFAWPRTFIVGP